MDDTVDTFTQQIEAGGDFIGSVSGAHNIRFRTSSAGTSGGSVSGSLQRNCSVIESIEFGPPPHKIGYELVHRDVSFSSAQTGATIRQPDSGNRFVVTDLIVVCGGSTDANVSIFDGSDSSGNSLFKGDIDISNNNQYSMNHSFNVPYRSSAVDNILKLTTDDNITISVVVHGYEV